MNPELDPLAWVAKAEEDYVVARLLLRRKKPLTHSACFHAQQCAEKYMKAILVAQGASFPKTHDLLLINDLCTKSGVLVPVAPKALNDLSAQAVRARYPGEDPTADEAREAIQTATAVRRFARKLLVTT